jgi:hypothetical protein
VAAAHPGDDAGLLDRAAARAPVLSAVSRRRQCLAAAAGGTLGAFAVTLAATYCKRENNMRRTVDYRSALVMAAALGGSAFVHVAPARALARQFRTGIAQLVNRGSASGPYLDRGSWASIRYSGGTGIA